MQSIIISSKNKQKGEDYALKICNEQTISPFDIVVVEQEKSVGIEDIREIQKKLFLSPVKGKNKAILIKNAETLTTVAQNALLKMLEEPPSHALIILITKSEDNLLPTILSRCKSILLENDNFLTNEELSKYSKFYEDINSLSVAQKFEIAQNITSSREEAISWLEKAILAARHQILAYNKGSGSSNINIELIRSLQKTHTIIQATNVAPRLVLENLFLSL